MKIIVLIIIAVVLWLVFRYTHKNKAASGDYPRYTGNYGYSPYSAFDPRAIASCAELLSVDQKIIKKILDNRSLYYKRFRIGKRSGGYRTISAPKDPLLTIQRTIYTKLILPLEIHPAATGFRPQKSIKDNAAPHLGNDYMLKTDIMDFFGSIHEYTVAKTFEKAGQPENVAKILAHLCCLKKRLPQGAPTSPALSNIIACEMDNKLSALAAEYDLTYTRYADDMTFSGNDFPKDIVLNKIGRILKEERFALKQKKTRYLTPNRRKIITGLSVCSGDKMTIPKATKREIRKNVHYVITKGLSKHQSHIGSNDPSYLKRLIGQLSFWYSIEPDNRYVIKNLNTLKRMEKRARS